MVATRYARTLCCELLLSAKVPNVVLPATTFAPLTVPALVYKAASPVKLTLRVVASPDNALLEVTLAYVLALACVALAVPATATKPKAAIPTKSDFFKLFFIYV